MSIAFDAETENLLWPQRLLQNGRFRRSERNVAKRSEASSEYLSLDRCPLGPTSQARANAWNCGADNERICGLDDARIALSKWR